MATVAAEVRRLREVQAIISAAAQAIKTVILARMGEVRNQFPTMNFATAHSHHVSSDEFGDHAVYKVGTFPGIPLTSRENMWSGRPYMVALMPEGILKYPYVIAEGRTHPHFPSGVTNDRLWTQFGEYALSLLYPRPVTTVMPGPAPEGLTADIGQEYCRYCQHVALAREFRFENRCPGCGSNSWLAQYNVGAD